MKRAAFTAVLLLACAHAPAPRDAAEITMADIADSFTAWVAHENERLRALPDGEERDVGFRHLSELNLRFNALEDAYDDVVALAESGRASTAAAVAALDDALRFAREMGLRRPDGSPL